MMISMGTNASSIDPVKLNALRADMNGWARSLGFDRIGVSDIDLSRAEAGLIAWLKAGFQGEMAYMKTHGVKRARPSELVPGTVRIISARMPYVDPKARAALSALADPELAYISRYALGRDYHKVLRQRLRALAQRIQEALAPLGQDHHYRVFSDSAPVMEVAIAEKAGLGWRGKHTLLLSRTGGSFFFLGEIFTNLPLPIDQPETAHCGQCRSCINICPTQAIVAPYQLDARRCISYLTIELKGSIPEHFRRLIGNRVYGCDDCQLACPWNRFAQTAKVADFSVRNGLDSSTLVALFRWDRPRFEARMSGSAIYRIGYTRWLRNLAVGLGNAPSLPAVTNALQSRLEDSEPLVREHVRWALAQHSKSPKS